MASGGYRTKAGSGGKREGAGRPKGSPNKLSRDIKEDILEVYGMLGGSKGLYKWAKENENDFRLKLLLRCVPVAQEVKTDFNGTTWDDLILCMARKRRAEERKLDDKNGE